MPCVSGYDNYSEDPRVRQELNDVTAMLCAVLGSLEDHNLLETTLVKLSETGPGSFRTVDIWWRRHRVADRKRREREAKEREAREAAEAEKQQRLQLMQQAMSKLTPEEIAAMRNLPLLYGK